MKKILRIYWLAICALLTGTALQGCKTLTISLCPSDIEADVGQKVVLKVRPLSEEQRKAHQFQWSLKDGDDWVPISGATNDTLCFKRIELDNTGRYRCLTYQAFPPGTNISAEVNLQVSTPPPNPLIKASVGAPSTGTLQTGMAGLPQTNCDGSRSCPLAIESPTGFAIIYSPAGSAHSPYWWGPAINATAMNATVADISQSVYHYSSYVAQVIVTECCPAKNCYVNYCGTTGTNSSCTFPVTKGNYYQFTVVARSPQLSNGRKLQATVTGGW